MAFERYYDSRIYEWIDYEQLHNEIEKIYKMNINQLVDRKDDYILRDQLDTGYSETYEGIVIGKTLMNAVHRAKKRGETLVNVEPISLLEVMGAVIEGIIIGDEYVERTRWLTGGDD
jgi:hypothetical protein